MRVMHATGRQLRHINSSPGNTVVSKSQPQAIWLVSPSSKRYVNRGTAQYQVV